MLDLHEGILQEFAARHSGGKHFDAAIDVKYIPAESAEIKRKKIHKFLREILKNPKAASQAKAIAREQRKREIDRRNNRKRNSRRYEREKEILRWIMMCGN